MTLSVEDFDYVLPPELIAQFPLSERSASRLLVLDGEEMADQTFTDLVQLLQPEDLLVFNDTKVLHARLHGEKVGSGGKIEVLVERILGTHEALAQIRSSKSPKPGAQLRLGDAGLIAEVMGRAGEFFHLRFADQKPLAELLERNGKLPLPPYIERGATGADESRYQTVYAKTPGSAAAPTAGLHFDTTLIETLRDRGVRTAWVTLHVGAGTFQPVRVSNLDDHKMHSELYHVPAETVSAIEAARAQGGRVVAVGTTSLRTLESAATHGAIVPGPGETRLFIRPGYRFQVVDALITNFHLPRSTLLMLVSALAGIEPIRRAYAHAVASRYRFFSYGDAMFIPSKGTAEPIRA